MCTKIHNAAVVICALNMPEFRCLCQFCGKDSLMTFIAKVWRMCCLNSGSALNICNIFLDLVKDLKRMGQYKFLREWDSTKIMCYKSTLNKSNIMKVFYFRVL